LNDYLRQCGKALQRLMGLLCKLMGLLRRLMGLLGKMWLTSKRLLREQFNKNIYTRILFTNVTAFVMALIVLILFSGFMVKQVSYDQVEQELLRKAKRVNFALLQQTDYVWGRTPDGKTNNQTQAKQDFLKYLADVFDARITIFDKEGTILDTSAEQEVVPGSKVEAKYVGSFTKGETVINRTIERETGQFTFVAVVPMGNNQNTVGNGILLETKASNVDLALNKIYFYLVIGGMALLVIIIIVSVYLAMYISRPISRLTTTVGEISRGGYVLNTDDQPLDEINVLAGQLNKLTERLQKIQTESLKMEEERARLFAEISHELRTPLTAVQGFVEAIRDGMVQDEVLRERYLDTIYTQTVHISRLVDDILVLSRLESGNITVEKLPVDLITLAEGVVISLEAMANGHNTSIRLEKKTEKAVVIGDVDRIEQIIRNLLKNAIRATENGNIRVGVAAQPNKEVVLTIEDNGIGIAPEDLPHIWERFYRVKNQHGSHRQERGSGLGLVIVKKLVQLQGGKIDVTSQLGKGTIFSIRFPSFNQK
jgi:signal transduction histidine kinase